MMKFYYYDKSIVYEALQLPQDINGYANAGDWIVIGSDNSQTFMSTDQFNNFRMTMTMIGCNKIIH